MRLFRPLWPVMVSCLFCVQAAQAGEYYSPSVGAQNNRHASHYNPWRPQPRQWGYASNGHNGHSSNDTASHSHVQVSTPMAMPRYAVPPSPVLARQVEYQRYVQAVKPYYGNSGLPWWSDPVAVPYGPWAIGNGWPNGLW